MQQQSHQLLSTLTKQNILNAFNLIHNPTSQSQLRKQADRFLIDAETQSTFIYLMKLLIEIYEDLSYNTQIRLQALLNLSNIIKRNWNNKRLLKTNKQFSQIKKHIQQKIIAYLSDATLQDPQHYNNNKILIPSLFEITKFIAKADYPHTFHELTYYISSLFEKINLSEEYIRIMKEIREIFGELAEKKGFVSRKNFEEGLRNLRNCAGNLGQRFKSQISENPDKNIVKLSKYFDQILICILRMSPYDLLDDEETLKINQYILQKLQFLLTLHSNASTRKAKSILQKNIKSIVYQLGCLQTANPCFLAPILSDYIQILFYMVSKPQIFAKTSSLKYALISMRKLIKQFTYYAETAVFLKSVSSNPKSRNYLELRERCHEAYKSFLVPETVEGMFNFLLTNIMTIKAEEDEGFSMNFEENFSYERSAQKQLTVHTCGTFLVQILIERFTEQMVQLIFGLVQNCMSNNWQSIDIPTQLNFFSAISVIPRSFKKSQLEYLNNFPIIQILQYIHSNFALRTKLPQLIVGWLEIFTNQQITSLVSVLIDFIGGQEVEEANQLFLYSCYSLNKILVYRNAAVDIGFVLYKIFPIAIRIFSKTDSPEILWPLINLISTLITKCQFDTNLIVSSLQNNQLNTLIESDSFMLVQALADMFKNFLCIIPRNQPAQAVFKIIYHFLNHNLKKTEETLHEKLVSLWYYAIREFSAVNHCDAEYLDLFLNHFRRCLFKMSQTLIYILEEYMLLGLIDNKLEAYLEIVLDFYKEANELESMGQVEQGKSLKIAALSFQITLITKYNLAEVNNEQMLWVILQDFCAVDNPQKTTPSRHMSGTLQNSLLSIVNRYLLLNKDFLFNFLSKINLDANLFIDNYFKNMRFLTSRTATKLNTIALISMIPFISTHAGLRNNFLLPLFSKIIPEIEDQIKNPESIFTPQKCVDNSPIYRFSVSVLSERKEQIRKETTYLNVNLKDLFLKEFSKVVTNQGGPIDFNMLCDGLGQPLSGKLRFICGV